MGIKSLFKHLLLTIVVLSMYACGGGGESSHKTIIEVQKQQSTNLVFADQKLTDCVQALIDSEGYTLIEQITELSCIGKEIADIEGIQNLSFLEILNLSQNQIRDITPISKLGRLKQLYLQGNDLQLLSPIAKNQLLEQVDISDNDAIICSEKDLLEAKLDDKLISEAICLDQMQQAETATFEDTNLQACIRQTAQEIGAQHLEQIQQLKCVNRDISNIDGIELLRNLRDLDLTQNDINDITPLQGLALLKKVLLGKNQISNMQPLTSSQYMQELRLDQNQLTDIQAVETLDALRQIHLTNNEIRDLTPLQSLTELLELRISNNRIIDIQTLANIPKLTSLWIQGNQIADLSPLQELQHLEQLWLSNNWLTDLTPLQTQSKLKWLHLDGTQAADLNPLNELTQLKWLQLDNTRVDDITAIYPLTKLDWLHLKGNNTIPCSQLDHMEDLITAEKIDRPETCSQPQEQTGNPISTIEFQDTALRDCVYDAAREQGIINAEELTTLSCPEAGIIDTTGLEQLTGIISLDISGNDVDCEQYMQLTYQFGKQAVNPPEICIKQLAIGGTVSGLGNGTALIIQNNEYDSLEVAENGTFTFAATVADAENYSVQVVANPQEQDQVCTIENSTGSLRGSNISSITVTCINVYSIGGTVRGLDNGGIWVINNENIGHGVVNNGAFEFPNKVIEGSSYFIFAHSQTGEQECYIENAVEGVFSGENITSDISDININCYSRINRFDIARSYPDYSSVKIVWNETGATSYTLLYSTQENFNPDEAEFVMEDVEPPVVLDNLNPKQSYYFIVKSEYDHGNTFSYEVSSQHQVKGFNGNVNVIRPQETGGIYVGGDFTRHGVVTGQAVPVSKETGNITWAYTPMLSGVYEAGQDGQGGWFVLSNRGTLNHILPDGSYDSEWKWEPRSYVKELNIIDKAEADEAFAEHGVTISGAYFDSKVYYASVSSIEFHDGVLYIAGSFEYINGIERRGIAALDINGNLLEWNPGPVLSEADRDPKIDDMVVYDNIIYVGGEFDSIGGSEYKNIAAISLDGQVLPWGMSVESIDESISYVEHIDIYMDTVYFSGKFNSLGGEARTNIAAITVDGELSNWGPILSDSPSSDGEIYTSIYDFAIANDMIYLCGSFNSADGIDVNRYGFAAISVDGAFSDFMPYSDGRVSNIETDDNRIYMYGTFSFPEQRYINGIAAFSFDGQLQDFDPGVRHVNEMVSSEGEIFITSNKSVIGGDIRNNIAAIDYQSNLLDWKPLIDGYNSEINEIVVDNEKIFLGGKFSQVNGQRKSGFSVVDKVGDSIDFGPEYFGGWVNSIAIGEDQIYIGGGISYVTKDSVSTTVNDLVAIDLNGDLLDKQPEIPQQEYWSDDIERVFYLEDRFVIQGQFKSINDEARDGFAALDIEGNLLDWNPIFERDDGYDVYINRVYESQGKIFVNGSFSSVNGFIRNNFAAFGGDGELIEFNADIESKTDGEYLNCYFISADLQYRYFKCTSSSLGDSEIVVVDAASGSIVTSVIDNNWGYNYIELINDKVVFLPYGSEFNDIHYGGIVIKDKEYLFGR